MKPESKGIRPEKQSITTELDERVSGALYMILADYTGMDMPQTTELKKNLRDSEATFNVVKNRMLKRSLDDQSAELLKGQTALIYGSGDVVEVAKVIRKFTAANKKPIIKGGYLEGKMISGEQVIELAKLPAKEVMQSILLATLQAPCTQLARVLDQKVASLVYVLDAARTKKEQEA